MTVNWTKEQKAVIESRNRNLLVSAAAGSGKTAVLVERIIRMITGDSPIDIDRLLVMTFTKAAAAEMRERIQAAIEKKLEEDPGNEHLQQQAVTVQFAQITTIDSFCLHILREHFDCIDIDPAFRVGDEGEMLLLRAEVLQELMEDSYANGGEAFERFVDTYSIGKADGGIEDYIMQVFSFAQSNPWPDKWFEHCRKELETTDFGELDRTEWMRFLLEDVRTQAKEWERQLEDVDLFGLAREICSRLAPQAEKKKVHLEVIGETVIYHGVKRILDEMIYNVCENAIKYNVSGGEVKIWAGNTLKGPKVIVQDTGIGIPEDQKERIFERFYRVDKSHSKETGGTGLGLSIVKHGAILHNAEITVNSKVGEGTRMEILFERK